MLIIAIIILVILIGGGLWSIWTALHSGEIQYGYKYYPPKYISNRKSDPFGFWLAVGLYALSVVGCIFLILFFISIR